MEFFAITDWDNAYANAPNIPGGEAYPDRWAKQASEYRKAMADDGRFEAAVRYGPRERNSYDWFSAAGDAKGTFVFVHGGYWLRFDPDWFSHLAQGALAHGWNVAMPRYTLCPQVRIADIIAETGQAIAAIAARAAGPLRLAGHSAGGHLVASMLTRNSPLAPAVQARIENTVSISGVHDLRPLLRLALNATLKLDGTEAHACSPALADPVDGAQIICWVGGSERSEFLRHNALLANVWRGLGARTAEVVEPDRHHFDVIDGLAQADSPLMRAILS